MSQLINITITNRGPLLEALKTPTSYGFDVEDIVSPITFSAIKSKAFFVARTNKGGINDDRNGSKINYESSETLSNIAAKSSLLLLLNVVSRRGVDKNNEEYVFVSSKITESLVPVTGIGTKFYYIEDGDNLPVEYIVSQTVAQIISQSSSGSFIVQDDGVNMAQEPKLNFVGYTVEDNPANQSTDIVAVKSIEYADLENLRSAGQLPLGAKYLITDRGDAGIIVDVSAPNIISLHAKGLFLNPDFQDVGDYSGLLIPKGNNKGVWFLAGQSGVGAFANDDIVFWNGIMYQVTDDSQFDTNSPDINTDAYSPLSKSVTNGYILEPDTIMYNFNNDVILSRKDKRGNIVENEYAVNLFQWGNDYVTYNEVNSSFYFNCINARHSGISSNIFIRGIIVLKICDSIKTCVFLNANLVINGVGVIKEITFDIVENIIISNNSINIIGGQVNREYSSLLINDNATGSLGEALELDLNDPTIFSGTILTIPTEYSLAGFFKLKNSGGSTITKIINLTTLFKNVRFIVEDGDNQIFSHTGIASAAANDLVSDGAANNTIVGRTNGGDFIEYQKIGNLNVRTNIVKLA